MLAMSKEVGWVFNWRQIAEDVTIAQGMPQKLINSDEQQDGMAQQDAQMQQAAVKAEMMQAAGKSVPGLSKAPEEGSMMDAASA